jgi:hypothetical protein
MRPLLGFCLFVACLVPAAAFADPPDARSTVVRLETIQIHGRQQRPVDYVLNRTAQRYRDRDARTSFVPNVVRTVRAEPF